MYIFKKYNCSKFIKILKNSNHWFYPDMRLHLSVFDLQNRMGKIFAISFEWCMSLKALLSKTFPDAEKRSKILSPWKKNVEIRNFPIPE